MPAPAGQGWSSLHRGPKGRSHVTDNSGNLILNNFHTFQDSPSELAFKYAVYKINKDPHILQNKTLTYDIQYVPREDSFRTTNKVHILL